MSAAGPPADGRLYSHQALWQETDASVAIGVLHGSSLLEDERRSGLNAQLSERVADGSFDAKRANLVEVNNVCDGGAALLAALRAVKRSSLNSRRHTHESTCTPRTHWIVVSSAGAAGFAAASERGTMKMSADCITMAAPWTAAVM